MDPQTCGIDAELGNFLLGAPDRDSGQAARLLLAEIDGTPDRPSRTASSWGSSWGGSAWPHYGSYGDSRGAHWGSHVYYDPGARGFERDTYYDWGRKFLSNGGQAYIDCQHLEMPTGECSGAFEVAAASRAVALRAAEAVARVNARLTQGRVVVSLSNSDGKGHTWGSHINVSGERRAFDRLVYRKPLPHLFLASFEASSVIWAGQGKVGSENGAPPADFQFLARGDFMESLLSSATTFRRPLVNTRDEPLGDAARFHNIFYDSNCLLYPTVLKVGALQLVLAMLGAGELNGSDLLLDDPLEALALWNRDLTLDTRVDTASGVRVSALDLQRRFHDRALRCQADGVFEGVVADSARLLEMWGQTLDLLAARDWKRLARRLDWALKLHTLTRAMELDRDLDYGSSQIQYLSQIYSSVSDDGLFWAFEAAGEVDSPVDPALVEQMKRSPSEHTRAWTRSRLLERHADLLEEADWDKLRFRFDGGRRATFRMAQPHGSTRQQMEPAFERCETLGDLLDDPDVADQVEETRDWHTRRLQ